VRPGRTVLPWPEGRFCRGLNGWQDGGLGYGGSGHSGLGRRVLGRGDALRFSLHHALDELGYRALAHAGVGDFGSRSEDAEGWVDGDLFDGLRFGCRLGGVGFGEIEAGDLKSVEEQAGAARVDVVGGDALQNLADGGLDRGAVLGQWKVERRLRRRRGFSTGLRVVWW
jgi:hypothetical protein